MKNNKCIIIMINFVLGACFLGCAHTDNTAKAAAPTTIKYHRKGKEYIARLATDAEMKSAGLTRDCSCGQYKCIGNRVYKCMAAGDGSCHWYGTNEDCIGKR